MNGSNQQHTNNSQTVTIDNREGGENGGEEKKKPKGRKPSGPGGALLGLAALAFGGSLVYKTIETNPEFICSTVASQLCPATLL